MPRKSFYFVRRTDRLTRGKPTFYVRFRDSEGQLRPWCSTGQTTKTTAGLWVMGRIGEAKKRRESMTLEAFTEGFWKPEGYRQIYSLQRQATPLSCRRSDRAAHGERQGTGSLHQVWNPLRGLAWGSGFTA